MNLLSKFYIILIGMVLIVISCKNNTSQSSKGQDGIQTKKEPIQLSNQFLSLGKWAEEGDYGFILQFDLKGIVKGGYREPQMTEPYEGTYTIQENKVNFMKTNKTKVSASLTTLFLKEDDTSLKYKYLLVDSKGKQKIWNILSKVPEGIEKKWNGFDIMTMGMKPSMVTSDVKIRKSPDINADVIAFNLVESSSNNPYGDIVTKQYMPKGYKVTVLARTKEKFKVQQWENYWYYVEYVENNLQSTELKKGWMFAEFVK